ncbi:MAG: hypothetical protein OXH75_25350 [Acidobacteria bacterium]|nr:hypothetical protein [Acidobacteriota bacterium]
MQSRTVSMSGADAFMFAVTDCVRECMDWPGARRCSVAVFGELLAFHMEEAYALTTTPDERLAFLATATAFDRTFGEPAVSGWIEDRRDRLFEKGY